MKNLERVFYLFNRRFHSFLASLTIANCLDGVNDFIAPSLFKK